MTCVGKIHVRTCVPGTGGHDIMYVCTKVVMYVEGSRHVCTQIN